MQKYIQNFAGSRNIDVYEIHLNKCEYCGIDFIQEIHHIESSMRGKRKDDPTKLIGVSRRCHEIIHSYNSFETRESLLNKVKSILNNL